MRNHFKYLLILIPVFIAGNLCSAQKVIAKPGVLRMNVDTALTISLGDQPLLTYQFSTTARDLTARHFERVDTGFTWLNIPPCLLAWGWKT